MINQLHFGISNLCNLNCKHCFVKNKEATYLNLDRFFMFFDALEEQGLTHIYYTYGEPLINDNIYEISRYIRKKGVFQILMTNGVLIDKSVALKIKKSGINRVMISLDSSVSKNHDANRGKHGAFNAAINAVKLLKENDVNVGIAVTVMENNTNELFEIEKMAQSLGIDIISFLAERNNSQVSLKMSKQYISLFKKAVKENKNYYFHDKRLIDILKKMHLNGEIEKKTYSKYKQLNTCHIKTNLSLAPNGDVYKCNFINNSTLFNINNDSISYKKMIDELNKINIKGCDFL